MSTLGAPLPAPLVHRSGSGPAVVLLHPLGVDRTVWDGLTAALDGWTVVTYDLPGHGEAPTPAERYTVEDLADQLSVMIEDEGLAPAHLVGVSLGGLVAQVVAARRPELVDRLVVVDAVATYPPPVVQQWRDRPPLVRSQGLEPLLQATLDLWFTAAEVRRDGPAVQTVRRLFLQGDPQGYARACEALEVADTRDLVPGITAPTLVVCGDDDAPPFTAAAPWFVETLPDARLAWLSPARHAGALEQPEQFRDAVVGFLRQDLPGDGRA